MTERSVVASCSFLKPRLAGSGIFNVPRSNTYSLTDLTGSDRFCAESCEIKAKSPMVTTVRVAGMNQRPTHTSAVWVSRTGPAPRQSESCQRHTRGDSDPLNAVEHIGDRRYAPDGSAGLEAPQLLATCGIKCVQIALVITAEDQPGSGRHGAA